MSLSTNIAGLVSSVLRLPQRFLMGVVQAYRLLLSPWLGSGCRFSPTCSAYALTALERHGAAYGSALAVWRIARCHPWCDGGLDPVPDASKHLFTSLLIKKSP
jgi:uncharacterized protein